jgi:hypothetical protein
MNWSGRYLASVLECQRELFPSSWMGFPLHIIQVVRPIWPLSQQQLIHAGAECNGSVTVSPSQLPTPSRGSMNHDLGALSPNAPSALSKHPPQSTTPKDRPSHLASPASRLQSSTIDAFNNRDSFAFLGGQFDQISFPHTDFDLRRFETACDEGLAKDGDTWDIMLHLPISTSI